MWHSWSAACCLNSPVPQPAPSFHTPHPLHRSTEVMQANPIKPTSVTFQRPPRPKRPAATYVVTDKVPHEKSSDWKRVVAVICQVGGRQLLGKWVAAAGQVGGRGVLLAPGRARPAMSGDGCLRNTGTPNATPIATHTHTHTHSPASLIIVFCMPLAECRARPGSSRASPARAPQRATWWRRSTAWPASMCTTGGSPPTFLKRAVSSLFLACSVCILTRGLRHCDPTCVRVRAL